MAIQEVCPSCQVKLRLPESGVGRCPKCKSIVRARVTEAPLASPEPEALTPILPEISPEDEVGPAGETAFAPAPLLPEHEPVMPPPLPAKGRRSRRRLPEVDIGNPLPRPSKTVPVTLLALAFVFSLLLVIGSFIFLIVKARDPRPGPVIVMPR